MAAQLRPEGIPVVVGDVVITTPGLTGEVEVYAPGSPGMRGEEQATADFEEALLLAGLGEQLSVVVSGHAELGASDGTRGSGGADDIVVEVPAPGDGNGQLMLYAAEDGSLSWHLPDSVAPGEVPVRGGERRTYRVPRSVVPVDQRAPGADRGLLGAVGTKVLKVLVFPLLDPVLGRVGDFFASRWEARHRLNRVRRVRPDGFADPDAPPFTDADWAEVRQGPALLLLHGTFAQAHTAFARLSEETVAELHRRYGGRLLALDHHSVSMSPKENADLLVGLVPPGPDLVLDVVTHSRGGLVGRELASAGPPVAVRSLVMVAAPNAGTVLADRRHLSDLLDRVTGLAQFVPDNGVTDTIGLVLAVLKQLAVGAVGGLDGLTSMDPGGDYLAELNGRAAPGSCLRAVAADYEPPPGAPLARVARDGATDLLFGAVENDLVVPTSGCYDVPGADGFPITDRLVFAADGGVDHNSFFGRPDLADRLLDWLGG
ncbi:esterase/lipase family protein [Nocardioides donggukensis]|uniref:Alpha/beta hydrolase n=1 Tax=Nocardioides donggukensis TaxID=2774019 RepID=A0A927K6R3_9ACTN|nr:alpha/beta hydrolase [Nocardioides donggukensis]MBD8870185.1 alpha/beta hydrolase [Nocardioides donggukensis]